MAFIPSTKKADAIESDEASPNRTVDKYSYR